MEERISHYRLLSRLGAGGMGEVYLAEDTKLSRKVAIKVLPENSMSDQQAKKRLVREAQAAATLEHTNICATYEIGEHDGRCFIVMQYLEGETLAERIRRNPIAVSELLDISIQIADALAEAHSRGIIHRDIKPANVMLTARGQVKVMDFGLAKVLSASAGLESAAETQSLLTEPGMIVGTVPYMSPEQVAGKAVTPVSDIFSLGAVLYEMATGRRTFRGDSQMAILAAILNQDPEPLPARLPSDLAKVILRCLRKDPARRFQTMADLKVALEDLREESSARSRKPLFMTQRRWVWLATLLALLAIGLLAVFVLKESRTGSAEPLRAVALTTLSGVERSPSLSPDGNYVVFSWTGPGPDNQDIYVQQIGSGSPVQRTTDTSDDYNPVWSPNGKWVAFLRSQPTAPTGLRTRELRIMPPLSGPERKLAEIRSQDFFPVAAYIAWSADSKSVVVTDSPGEGQPDALFVVSVETGEKRQLTNAEPPVLADISPAISPDGRSIIFLRRTLWAAGELQLLSLGAELTAAGEPRRLTPVELGADFPAWMPEGKEVVFTAKGGLWRMAVIGGGTPTRIPFVGEDALTPAISRPADGKPPRLVYVRSFNDDNFWRIETSAVGAPTTFLPVMAISSTKREYHCKFSPDGSKVVFSSNRSGDQEIWVSDPNGSNAVQLTNLHALDANCPSWSPDGQLIVFSATVDREFEVFTIPAAGGKPRRVTSNPSIDLACSFSRDGKWIYFNSTRSGDYRVWKVPVDGGDEVLVTPNQGGQAFESSDGKYLYYLSTSINSPLWRIPLSGGAAMKVLDGVTWFNLCLVERGASYIDQLDGDRRLRFLNFATDKPTTVAHNLGEVRSGLAVSPDGKTILFARTDSSVDDLMIVENFK